MPTTRYPLSTKCQGTNSDNDDGDVSLPEDSDTGSEDEPIANRYNGLGKKAPLGKKALSADKNAPSAKVTPPAQTLAATATEKSLPDESDSEKALPVRRDRAKKQKNTPENSNSKALIDEQKQTTKGLELNGPCKPYRHDPASLN